MFAVATVKALKKNLNANRHLMGPDRANSATVGVYADAVRDTGDNRLADVWDEVFQFMPVLQEHRRVCWSDDCRSVTASDRAKYIAIDTDGGGMFMIDKETGQVYTIKAYGRPKCIVCQSLRELRVIYQRNIDRQVERNEQRATRLLDRRMFG
jgi:hypothetical protein